MENGNQTNIPQYDEELVKKVNSFLDDINEMEKEISNTIDDFVEKNEKPITITQINCALINILKKMNQKELTNLISGKNV